MQRSRIHARVAASRPFLAGWALNIVVGSTLVASVQACSSATQASAAGDAGSQNGASGASGTAATNADGRACAPGATELCYSGPQETLGKGTCRAGQKLCGPDATFGACTGEITPQPESCNTPGADTDCNGRLDLSCEPLGYRFSASTSCAIDGRCYHDEPHDTLTAGDAGVATGFQQYASGQLVDGVKGTDDWAANLGHGVAYEWVGWDSITPVVTFQLPEARAIHKITVGISNSGKGGVNEPWSISVALSTDDTTYGAAKVFSRTDGQTTLAAVPSGQRGDVELDLDGTQARFVKLQFAPNGWTFLDEVVIE
jgi:hypothetical protein